MKVGLMKMKWSIMTRKHDISNEKFMLDNHRLIVNVICPSVEDDAKANKIQQTPRT